jgi:hypothetical protein
MPLVTAAAPNATRPTPDCPDGPLDDKFVIGRLEEAGATLLALPGTGWTTKLRSSSLEIVRTAIENYGWTENRIRPAIPSAARITRMDEAMGWITLIPLDRYVLRRIVGARSLVSPTTDRHLFPWRRLAKAIGADHKAVQRWHRQGIDMIVTSFNHPGIGPGGYTKPPRRRPSA